MILMFFLLGLVSLVMAVNFSVVLVGGDSLMRPQEFLVNRFSDKPISLEQGAVGITTLVFGGAWLLAWVYFVVVGWSSMAAQQFAVWPHVFLQLLASLGLVLAGYSILKQWIFSMSIYLGSVALVVFNIVVALLYYSPHGHGEPIYMYLIAAWTLAIVGILTTGLLLLDKLVHPR